MNDDRLVFTDLETMGLDYDSKIVEVAMVICTSDLTPVARESCVVRWDMDTWAAANEFARDMHRKSGLYVESLVSVEGLAQVEQRLLRFLERNGFGKKQAVIAGNSIAQDRIWIATQMATLHHFLSHRMVDVSGVRLLIQRWADASYTGPAGQGVTHRAMDDALWSLKELTAYKAALFADASAVRQRLA